MLRIYNTLSRSVEQFSALKPPQVGMYSCGPTVYDYAHIGHIRRYVGDDIIIRILTTLGFQVTHVMNITDVGHLVSDADEGEDKMEKGARKLGKNVWEVAKMFEEQFFDSTRAVGVKQPDKLMHATDYIKEQIDLIRSLGKKGYTYRIPDGIYFDTSKFPNYFALSRQKGDELKPGARVEVVKEKKHITDFALWKFDPHKRKTTRGMNWWFEGKYAGEPVIGRPASGSDLEQASKRYVKMAEEEKEAVKTIGFPGWHIECSAMSLQGLFGVFDSLTHALEEEKVQTIDIHTGGIDHIDIHHTNEIAQAEAVTGKPFVRYWVHHNHLLVSGEKMSKSLGNFITVQDVVQKGFDPLALRYLYLQTHYRAEMNFTWESLAASEKALNRLRAEVAGWDARKTSNSEYDEKFIGALSDDINTAKAIGIMWEMIKSDIPNSEKAGSLKKMDTILGLALFRQEIIPEDLFVLIKERETLRKAGNFVQADTIRQKIRERGYDVSDTKTGSTLMKIPQKT